MPFVSLPPPLLCSSPFSPVKLLPHFPLHPSHHLCPTSPLFRAAASITSDFPSFLLCFQSVFKSKTSELGPTSKRQVLTLGYFVRYHIFQCCPFTCTFHDLLYKFIEFHGIYVPLFTCQLRTFKCFHLLANVNRARGSTAEQGAMGWVCPWDIRQGVGYLGHMLDYVYAQYSDNSPPWFLQCPSQTVMRAPLCLHPHQHLFSGIFLL